MEVTHSWHTLVVFFPVLQYVVVSHVLGKFSTSATLSVFDCFFYIYAFIIVMCIGVCLTKFMCPVLVGAY